MNQKGLGMFWKDKERRFVGVNAAFLRYYNLKISDLLGKNDEDMGWHPDPEPFKRDEESSSGWRCHHGCHGRMPRQWEDPEDHGEQGADL